MQHITGAQAGRAARRETRTIEVERFVDLADIDPVFFDHPYWMLPGTGNEGALRAYRLLVEVMAKTERAALRRFVMRAKEYLAVIRVRDGALTLTTMRFHDEVRPTRGVGAPSGKQAKPAKQTLEQAVALIEAHAASWDPERYRDRYRERLQKVVRDKRKGKTVKLSEPAAEPEPVPDLMAALKESLEAAKRNGKGRSRRRAKAAA